jgi:hypothetical protein
VRWQTTGAGRLGRDGSAQERARQAPRLGPLRKEGARCDQRWWHAPNCLPNQPGLADAGRADNRGDGRTGGACGREHRAQQRQLRLAPDERQVGERPRRLPRPRPWRRWLYWRRLSRHRIVSTQQSQLQISYLRGGIHAEFLGEPPA